MGLRITTKPFIITATALAIASGLAAYVWYEEHRPPLLEIYVFSLKSGQSAFIRTPNDKRILINGGANSDIIRELTHILPFYSRRIDTVIVMDTDDKNVSGLIDVLNRYKVERVIGPAITLQSLGLASTTNGAYSTFIDTVTNKKIPLQEVLAGDRIIFDQSDMNSVAADVLFPLPPNSFQYSKASGPELILRVSYDQKSVLFLGDATMKVQKALGARKELPLLKNLTDANDSHVGVLVVPHGAGPTDLSLDFMNQLLPEFIVYSKTVTRPTSRFSPTSAQGSKSQSGKSSSANKKTDPLYFITAEKRFNLKEQGTVKIVLDGKELRVETK